jgi:glycosyltransferase involved in cell wall biosynthesis
MSTTWIPSPPPVVPAFELPPQPIAARVKVLHVITKLETGAGGNTFLSAVGMDRTRYEVWIAAAPKSEFWERAELGGVNTVRLGRFRETISPLNDVIVLAELVRLIRRERFAIVHTHNAKGGFLGRLAAWLCRVPVVVHTFHSFSFHDFMSTKRRWAYLLLERLARRHTDEFLAVAPQVAREAVEYRVAPPGRITVAPSAIELEDIPRRDDKSVRLELGVAPSAPLIGTVGRICFQKSPLDFVRMAARVAERWPDARFVMVGEGPLTDDVQREARRLGVDVIVTGFRNDAVRITAALDVFVMPSLYEGLGRALTEAMACQRPVVATAVNGVTDLVRPGRTGLLAPPADPDSIAENVLWLLDHPDEAARMGRQGRETVLALFHPSHMCALIDETYCRLLGLPDPGSDRADEVRSPGVDKVINLADLSGSDAPEAADPAARRAL